MTQFFVVILAAVAIVAATFALTFIAIKGLNWLLEE